MNIPFNSMLTGVAALAIVLGLILFAAQAAKKTGLVRQPAAGRLALRDTLVLDRVRRLHIVRCDGRELLILTGGTTEHVAGWLPDAPGGQMPEAGA